MLRRTLFVGAITLVLTASAAIAADLTTRMQTERMTVVQVDRNGTRLRCAEHGRWMLVTPVDVGNIGVGDIVGVDRVAGQPSRARLVRSAATELSSPE
jgi:hypothetical protein